VRFDSPVERTITRWVAADRELGGQTLRRGELVIAVVGSANRDGAQVTGADALDLARADNKHVGFGRGPHYCLGAPLARLETEIALETLLRRLPNLRLAIAAEDLYWRPIPLFRSLAALPVEWDA
jgi:cytochrome P450